MTSKLDPLEGQVVSTAAEVEDYLQLHFRDGACLNIFNPVSLSGVVSDRVEALAERRLTTVTERAESITLRFDDASTIVVDMRDEAYRGPEALELRIPGEAIVVWR